MENIRKILSTAARQCNSCISEGGAIEATAFDNIAELLPIYDVMVEHKLRESPRYLTRRFPRHASSHPYDNGRTAIINVAPETHNPRWKPLLPQGQRMGKMRGLDCAGNEVESDALVYNKSNCKLPTYSFSTSVRFLESRFRGMALQVGPECILNLMQQDPGALEMVLEAWLSLLPEKAEDYVNLNLFFALAEYGRNSFHVKRGVPLKNSLFVGKPDGIPDLDYLNLHATHLKGSWGGEPIEYAMSEQLYKAILMNDWISAYQKAETQLGEGHIVASFNSFYERKMSEARDGTVNHGSFRVKILDYPEFVGYLDENNEYQPIPNYSLLQEVGGRGFMQRADIGYLSDCKYVCNGNEYDKVEGIVFAHPQSASIEEFQPRRSNRITAKIAGWADMPEKYSFKTRILRGWQAICKEDNNIDNNRFGFRLISAYKPKIKNDERMGIGLAAFQPMCQGTYALYCCVMECKKAGEAVTMSAGDLPQEYGSKGCGCDEAKEEPTVSALPNAQNECPENPGVIKYACKVKVAATRNFPGGKVKINVRREGGSQGDASIDYATADGTAIAGTDYVAKSGSLTWGDLKHGTRSFELELLGVNEETKILYIDLSNPQGAELSDHCENNRIEVILPPKCDGEDCDC